MAKVRWTGEGDREVAVELDGSTVQVDAPRLEWIDVPVDVARSLNQQDGWELHSARQAQRTRAANEAADGGDEMTDAPAEGDDSEG